MNQLWTPWRSKYIQENKEPGTCIFCAAASDSAEDKKNLVLFRGEHTFIILNRYPYSTGHLMIAPYAHVSRLNQSSPAATQEMMELLRQGEEILQQSYRCNGLNLGMNLGEAAGAGIEEHIHMHLLPRWYGDANFMTVVGHTRVLPEVLEDTYSKLEGKFTASRMS
jgi:ATP adenylyltransferase